MCTAEGGDALLSQDGVVETIEAISEANIKLWMLTGDKKETAISIGYSTSLLLPGMVLFQFAEEGTIEEKLKTYSAELKRLAGSKKTGLIVEGFELLEVWKDPKDGSKNQTKDLFLSVARQCDSVIACRVSPAQKAEVTLLLKVSGQAITLSIGDGANDVPMIQSAHIGVGISGLEGRQAVLAADYSIAQFKFLRQLLLCHGRRSYHALSRLVVYFLYKNMTFTVPGAIFAFYISRSGGILYDGTLQAGFNMVFTSMPPFFFAIFDYDLESAPSGGHDKAYHYPKLYLSGQNGDSFNLRRFSRYAVLALAQGVVITLLGAIFNDLVAANGQTLGFYSLGLDVYGLVVLVVLMKLAQLMNTWTWLMCAIPHKPAGWALHSAHHAVHRVFELCSNSQVCVHSPIDYFVVRRAPAERSVVGRLVRNLLIFGGLAEARTPRHLCCEPHASIADRPDLRAFHPFACFSFCAGTGSCTRSPSSVVT